MLFDRYWIVIIVNFNSCVSIVILIQVKNWSFYFMENFNKNRKKPFFFGHRFFKNFKRPSGPAHDKIDLKFDQIIRFLNSYFIGMG